MITNVLPPFYGSQCSRPTEHFRTYVRMCVYAGVCNNFAALRRGYVLFKHFWIQGVGLRKVEGEEREEKGREDGSDRRGQISATAPYLSDVGCRKLASL